MKKFVALLLCLSLSIFTVARAMKPGHALAGVAKIDQKKPTGQKAGAKILLNDANKALAAMIKADDDSMEDASDDDEGENMSDDDSGSDDDGGGDDCGDVESIHQSRPARLGQHHTDLQSLCLVQDRRPAMVVDSVDANSFC